MRSREKTQMRHQLSSQVTRTDTGRATVPAMQPAGPKTVSHRATRHDANDGGRDARTVSFCLDLFMRFVPTERKNPIGRRKLMKESAEYRRDEHDTSWKPNEGSACPISRCVPIDRG